MMIAMPGFTYGGHEVFDGIGEVVRPYGTKVCVIGEAVSLSVVEPYLLPSLKAQGLTVTDVVDFGVECSYENGKRIAALAPVKEADVFIAVGGGKSIDTVKLVSGELDARRFITIPTIAATCAATSRIAAVYTENHEFCDAYYNKYAAIHSFIDADIIAGAPARFLRGGIGDTIAKYYESGFSARGAKNIPYEEEWGLSMAPMCAKPLIRHAVEAMASAEKKERSEAFDACVKSIVVATGYVSGMLSYDLNTSLAHCIAYGLLEWEDVAKNTLHGEQVAYGTLVLLAMDEQWEDFKTLRQVYKEIGIPVTLKDFGLDLTKIDRILRKTMSLERDLAVSPYKVTEEKVRAAMEAVENYHA